MRSHALRAVLVSPVLTVLIAGSVSLAQVGKPYGAASPQEAVAAIQKATAANDMLRALPVIAPTGLRELADEGVTGILMVLAFSDPDDPMPGGPTPSKAELAAQRKRYTAAMDLARATLKPYGLDAAIGKPVLAEETQKVITGALATADNVVLITSLYGAMGKIGPLLGMKQDPKPRPVVTLGTVTGYKIDGDRATAQNGAETLQFVRIDGRWYLEPPASAPPGGSQQSTATTPDTAGAPPAIRSTASGKTPEVVAGGLQIARVIVPGSDFSARPFNADNGTTLALWVKMPAGQGLIAIDEDASVLQSFGDDRGTNMGGRFGSFPQEFEDGSGGILEIESTGFPSASATAIVAEGTVTMTVSTGTRKTRVANVRLQDDAKFTFGKTPITVSDVSADGERQSFTINLPRQVMETIRAIVFLDAKGQPLEGSVGGRGYFNDAAEMQLSVQTTAKTLTLEFEAWQGLRTTKVPFKVRAGLALD